MKDLIIAVIVGLSLLIGSYVIAEESKLTMQTVYAYDSNGRVLYEGYGPAVANTTQATWIIKKHWWSTTGVYKGASFADSKSNAVNIWANRTTYTYRAR